MALLNTNLNSSLNKEEILSLILYIIWDKQVIETVLLKII